MTDTALAAAVTRLERAIARLEQGSTPPGPTQAETALTRLEERHARLRARVQETVARLDALIETQGDAT